MSEPEEYPPARHVTRDLASVIERDAEGSTILLPIVPELLDAGGRLRVGAAATIVDIVCGETAIRAVLPGWIATSSLSLQIGEMPATGTLRAKPRIVRHGKTTLVEEVVLDHVESGEPVGLGTVTFAILPGKTAFQTKATWAEEPEPRTTFATDTSGFEKPLLETLGVRFGANDPSVAHLDTGSYVVNTLGAMQGGVIAMLIDAAADHFAASELGAAARVRTIEIQYMKLAKIGPIRANVSCVASLSSACILRVELRDEGQEDALLTIAGVVADRA